MLSAANKRLRIKIATFSDLNVFLDLIRNHFFFITLSDFLISNLCVYFFYSKSETVYELFQTWNSCGLIVPI